MGSQPQPSDLPPDIGTGGLHLRSAIPGRERWDVESLSGHPLLARLLEEALGRQPAVFEVRANPVSGRLLVLFDPDDPDFEVASVLREILFSLRDLPDEEPAATPDASAWALTRTASSTPLSRVLSFALPERGDLLKPALLSIAGQSLNLLQGFAFVATVNTARGEEPAILRLFGIKRTSSRLAFMGGVSLLLILLNSWVQWCRKKAWHEVAQAAERRLGDELVRCIEGQDLAFLNRYGTARLARFVTDDAYRIGELVQTGGDRVVEIAVIVLVSGTAVLLASPLIGLILCLPLPLFVASSRLIGRRANAAYEIAHEAGNQLAELLEDSLGGLPDVRSFTAEPREELRLAAAGQRATETIVAAASKASLQARVNEAAASLGFNAAATYAGLLAASGRITQERFNLLIALLPKLVSVPEKLGEIVEVYHQAVRSADSITTFLDTRPTIQSGPLLLPAPRVRGEVAFEHVTFAYQPGHPVLLDVSFAVRPGEILGIVGPTGSGKSTLLRLLLRFYDVASGRILLDGTDIRELDLRDLRSAVGVVNQDVYLFSGTVRDNVTYGRPGAADEQVVAALNEAGAQGLLRRLPGGLDASVGERGGKLSGGERQRVAIARALLKDPPILALDEATSHLDYETEAAVQRSIGQAAEGKSVIMIAHRLALVRHAARILVLERGRIREAGRHEDLLAAGGLYASLWELQSGASPMGGRFEVRVAWPDDEA